MLWNKIRYKIHLKKEKQKVVPITVFPSAANFKYSNTKISCLFFTLNFIHFPLLLLLRDSGWFCTYQSHLPPLWPRFNPELESYVGWVSANLNRPLRVFLPVLRFSSLIKIHVDSQKLTFGCGQTPLIRITPGILPFHWIKWINI